MRRFDPNTIYECERNSVIEMYLGVGFAPLVDLDVPHFGLFWGTIRDRFPKIESKPPILPPLAPDIEFKTEQGTIMKVQQGAAARYWFLEANDSELIQLQADRFIRNWRTGPLNNEYPRYSELKQRFFDSWIEFLGFASAENIPSPAIIECEIGYVNRIEIGDRPITWAIPPLAGFHDVSPEVHVNQVQVTAKLDLPAKIGTGQLAVAPTQSKDPDTGKAWRYSLVAKGSPQSSDIDGLSVWFDSARGWLNHLFFSTICDDLHREWGTRARA